MSHRKEVLSGELLTVHDLHLELPELTLYFENFSRHTLLDLNRTHHSVNHNLFRGSLEYELITPNFHSVLEDHQILSSAIGWSSNDNNIESQTTVPLDPSVCTHAMLNMDKSAIFKVDNVEEDWRFKNSVRLGSPPCL